MQVEEAAKHRLQACNNLKKNLLSTKSQEECQLAWINLFFSIHGCRVELQYVDDRLSPVISDAFFLVEKVYSFNHVLGWHCVALSKAFTILTRLKSSTNVLRVKANRTYVHLFLSSERGVSNLLLTVRLLDMFSFVRWILSLWLIVW